MKEMTMTPTTASNDASARASKLPLYLGVIAAFMVFVDSTIVNVALPSIGHDLTASRSELEWVVNAYALTFAAIMLGSGALADALGAKRVFMIGMVVFTVMSIVCALSGSMLALNTARFLQGVGAALLLPSALKLATKSVTDETMRHRLVGLWAAAGGLGLAAGPLLGGLLIELGGWTMIFWVNVLPGVATLVLGARSLPAMPGHDRKLDVFGQITVTAAIAGLVCALIEAPSRGWIDPLVLVAFAIALVGLIVFVVAERRAASPLLPGSLYRDKTFVGSVLQGAMFNFVFYGLLFGLSLLLHQVGFASLQAGLAFLPLTGLVAIGNVVAPRLAARVGRPKVLLIGQCGLITALLLVAVAGHDNSLLWLLIGLVPAGFASGLLVPTMTSQTLVTVEPAMHGTASAAFNTARQLGAAIGVSVFGPLLGSGVNVANGFAVCMFLGAAVTVCTVALTVTTQRTGAIPA